ncbi:MAG: hypothetical protein J6M39_06580 [Lachnospiraceae bacterium]|nr:hypothetical protein [Lachnospiraceae bacterium]
MLSRSDKKDYGVFMEIISEKTEQELDRQMNIHNNFTYINLHGKQIKSSAVYLYGTVNLDNQKDINYLLRYKNAILNPFNSGNWYYTTFNYETGEIQYNEQRKAYLGINFIGDYLKWFKYNYCIIGKPKRIIIYKHPLIRREN